MNEWMGQTWDRQTEDGRMEGEINGRIDEWKEDLRGKLQFTA